MCIRDRITTGFAAIMSQISGIPYSFTAHAFDIFGTNLRFRNDTLPVKVAWASRVVCEHKFGIDILRSACPKVPLERFQVIYNGIDLNLFRPCSHAANDGVLRILNIGRWEQKKSLDTLVLACEILRQHKTPFAVKIIGTGPEEPLLRKLIVDLNLEDYIELCSPCLLYTSRCV